MELGKEPKDNVIKTFGIHGQDTGSADVQAALLTSGILHLTNHCQQHPKDFSSRRGLQKMVCQRRKMLDYLARKNPSRYAALIKQLGLRK